MTIESQKIALLEWAGWKKAMVVTGHKFSNPDEDLMEERWLSPWGVQQRKPPNLDSLDVLAEFEAKLMGQQQAKFIHELTIATARDAGKEWRGDWHSIHASAPQRLEAIVRALGLWREGE